MKRENKMNKCEDCGKCKSGLEGRIIYEEAINRHESETARIVTLQNALYKEERDHNQLMDKYEKLQDDYLVAQEEITNLNLRNNHLKNRIHALVDDNNDTYKELMNLVTDYTVLLNKNVEMRQLLKKVGDMLL